MRLDPNGDGVSMNCKMSPQTEKASDMDGENFNKNIRHKKAIIQVR